MTTPSLPRAVIEVGDGFWNIRGSFKIAGFIDIGTQASLVRRKNGKLLLLDGCAFSAEVRAWLKAQTRDGDDLEAVLHLHPFHTLFVERTHELFPKAALYGSARHVEHAAALPWNALRVDDPKLHQQLADDLDFSVPRGVDFISTLDRVHFSSVLAFHSASKTLHVDDTLIYLRLPPPLSFFKRPVTRFHPTLPKVLQRRPGAAGEFRAWAKELIERAAGVENLCAAHSAALLGRDNQGEPIAARIREALDRVEHTLEAHERAHG